MREISTGDVLTVPNVIRNMIPKRIVNDWMTNSWGWKQKDRLRSSKRHMKGEHKPNRNRSTLDTGINNFTKPPCTAPLLNPTHPSNEDNISNNFPTSYRYSRFYIKSKEPLQLCGTLEVSIEARNIKNEPKLSGGDYFWIWLYTKDKLQASAAADEIIDHLNGTYTARFQLHWSGKVDIAVSLVHSREEVSILKRNREKFPARCAYQGKFQSRNVTKITLCHITQQFYLPPTPRPVNRAFCNFTDKVTGFPWYCMKPDGLPCDSYIAHAVTDDRGTKLAGLMMSEEEMRLFSGPNLISSTTESVEVRTKDKKTKSECTTDLPDCYLGITPRSPNHVAGFYYKDEWNSLVCKNRVFKTTETMKCLQNKTLHFWGDSTLRQWYEYLVAVLPFNETKGTNVKFGPHVAVNEVNNVTLHYRHHGYPIRSLWTPVVDIYYVPNLIDAIRDTGDDIVLSLWAHFTATSLNYYQNRWEAIKQSILRLKTRKPGTRVIIKSANTREKTSLDHDSWYAWELDKLMRKIIYGVSDVTIIDVWDMTVGHRTGYEIHPAREVISQEIGMLLSFICPDNV
ncbi:NXPE family member 3-like [Amphiura filiformis]|uniref:NXPE family member 3-like n=1 Tax=Amphiura filiformis TaxID=82378 RepID=UPI003B21E8FC